MASIRPETEVDRTEVALAGEGLALPLARGAVEIAVGDELIGTPGGQRIVSLLVNILARMKGVVDTIHVISPDSAVVAGTPLPPGSFIERLVEFVESLNWHDSPYHARLIVEPSADPVVRIGVGVRDHADLVIACDAWRALIGGYSKWADWSAANPIGAALAAVVAAVEAFKYIVAANGGTDATFLPEDFAYSAYNYGVNDAAATAPDVSTLALADTAIIGCGAGGSGTAFLLAMHPGIYGVIDLVEPGTHKLSNLNRYLAATAADVHAPRHKLSSLVAHLAVTAPNLDLNLHPRTWEQLERQPWVNLVSAVDSIESRWQLQLRSCADATIIDIAVDDLLYSALLVVPGGRCLYCKHPYDADLALKQRALRWGVPLETVRHWTDDNRPVDQAMITRLAATQGIDVAAFAELLGRPFRETPQLLECGSTSLRADVPSQAPVLPLATSAVSVVAASEIIKQVSGGGRLDNWLAHDLRRNPAGPWTKHRGPIGSCPHH